MACSDYYSRTVDDLERELFSLPISLGGLGICDPHQASRDFYEFSRKLSRPLVDLILQQCDTLPHDVIDSQYRLFKKLSQTKHQNQMDRAQSVLSRSPNNLCQSLECCKEKGASSWLSVIPVAQHGFALYKTDFTDALCLRYGWSPPHLPSHCVCRKAFTISHALSCPHGAFPIIRHNDVRDLTAKLQLMSEVCHDAQVESHPQPLSGELLHHKLKLQSMRMMLGSTLGLLASGVVAIIALLLMFGFLTFLLSLTSLLVQLQLFGDMRLKNVRLMRSVSRGQFYTTCVFLFRGYGQSCHSHLQMPCFPS